MNALGKFKWSIWIGVWTGIYVFLYLISPLAQYGILWASFVAFPIFFMGGAAFKSWVPFMISSVIGVLWGIVMLWGIGLIAPIGPNLSMAIAVGFFTITTCMMMMLPDKSMVNIVPAMFGGISTCFSQGGENIIPLMITLCLGATLALVCGLGSKFIAPDGKWQKPGKKAEA